MLSKLYHFEEEKECAKNNIDKLMIAIKSYFEKKNMNVQIKYKEDTVGTLGIIFELELNRKKMYVKTHQIGESYRYNLKKEIMIMQFLYGDIIELYEIDIKLNDDYITFFIMDELEELDEPLSCDEIRLLIKSYSEKLSNFKVNEESIKYTQWNDIYNFSNIQKKASEVLKFFIDNNIISKKLYCKINEIFLLSDSIKFKKCICHGDLSNKNILKKNGKLIVIDWEDSILGVDSYDINYWMTFFEQRKYYKLEIFRKYNLNNEKNLYLMSVITVIKCYLSYINGSYLKNKISIEDRLWEILRIFT